MPWQAPWLTFRQKKVQMLTLSADALISKGGLLLRGEI